MNAIINSNSQHPLRSQTAGATIAKKAKMPQYLQCIQNIQRHNSNSIGILIVLRASYDKMIYCLADCVPLNVFLNILRMPKKIFEKKKKQNNIISFA